MKKEEEDASELWPELLAPAQVSADHARHACLLVAFASVLLHLTNA
jgi:hypothetical protein